VYCEGIDFAEPLLMSSWGIYPVMCRWVAMGVAPLIRSMF